MPEHTPGPIPGQLPDFPDLATPAARTTMTPPFEQIVARARRRRRRNVLGVAAVTAAVLAAVATGTALNAGHDDTAPQPTKRHPSRGSTATPVAVDAARIILTGGLVSYAAAPDGSLLTVWKKCADETGQTGCHSAWQLQTDGDTYQGLAKGDSPSSYAGGGAFVVDSWNTRGVAIDDQGRSRPIRQAGSGTVTAGDVFVGDGKALVVVDPRTATSWPLGAAPDGGSWIQAAVSADGTTWAMSTRGNDLPVVWRRGASDGPTWHQHVMASTDSHDSLPGYLAVSGDHVAALSGFDGATVLPVADLAVTADGGRTWTDLHQADLPFRYVDAMAATSGGTLFIATPGGEQLYRSTDATWTRFAAVPNPEHLDGLEPAGATVLGRRGTFTDPQLFALDDAGHTTEVSRAR